MLEIIILCWLNFNGRTDGLEVWYTEEFMDISMTVSGPGPVAAKKKEKAKIINPQAQLCWAVCRKCSC